MRLNPDCIRDILLTVEGKTGFGTFMRYPEEDQNYSNLEKYPVETVLYHIKQCQLSVLLTKVDWFFDGGCLIHDLSPQGHEFLANIRSDNNWSRTKEIAQNVGSFSLQALSQIAVSVVTALINKQF